MSAEHITVVAGSLTVTDDEDANYVTAQTRDGLVAALDSAELEAAIDALTAAKYRRQREANKIAAAAIALCPICQAGVQAYQVDDWHGWRCPNKHSGPLLAGTD